MSYALRQYQDQAITDLRESLKLNKRVILALTTGGGKTVIFSSIVAGAASKGKKVLIITNRVELFKQTFKAIDRHDIPVCKIDAKNKRIDLSSNIFIAMIETLKRRAKMFTDFKFDLIIIDECHLNSFNKIFELWPDTKVIGCSATPCTPTLHKYYQEIVQPIDTLELISQGFLVPCKAYQMQDDFSDLKTDKSGEFTNASLDSHFRKSKLYEGVIDAYVSKCNGSKAICFNVNIEHTLEMTRAFNAAGIPSRAITSITSEEERNSILSDFKHGHFLVLNNCGILTTGFDEPSIETVILNRATGSLILFLQMIGRGSRLHIGKNYFTVLDMGENHNRFGLWMQNREWSLDPPKKKKKKLSVAPVRECKSCGAILPVQQRKCEFCGHEMTDKEKELLKGELVEVKAPEIPKVRAELIGLNVSECSIADLIELEASKAIKSSFAWRILRSRGEADVIAYAGLKGYRNGWIARQLEILDFEAINGGTEFKNIKIKERV